MPLSALVTPVLAPLLAPLIAPALAASLAAPAGPPGPVSPVAPAPAGAVGPVAATERPAVRLERMATAEISPRAAGDWQGQVSFGFTAVVTDRGRIWRPAPTRLHLEREACDALGCMRTVITLPEGTGVRVRVGSGLAAGSLGPATTAVRVMRMVEGTVVSDRIVALDLHVHLTALAPPTDAVAEETVDGQRRVILTRGAPARASIVVAGETIDAFAARLALVRTATYP